MLWRTLYSKLRADIAASLASGGLTAVVLAIIDYAGLGLSAQEIALISSLVGWAGGKLAAYMRVERGPAVVREPLPPGGEAL